MSISSIRIRLAGLDDLAGVQSCARAAYTKYLARMGRVPAPMVADFANQIETRQTYCALQGSLLVGYVVFYRELNHLQLENVAVLPMHSGKGIGKMLISYVEHKAVEAGLEGVEL